MTGRLGRVMIIDDEDIDQRQYRRLIERSGMAREIIQFTYADEALDWLKSTPDGDIDLIFLDVNIPRMNGFQFLEAAQEHWGDTPPAVIVMLTTSLAAADRDRAHNFKAVRGFFSKPLTRGHLDEAATLLHTA